jgi:membrane-bound lytic murein transglycosylase D
VKVPPGTAARAAKSLSKQLEGEAKLTRYVVRWGESLDEIAARLKVTRSSLQSLNGLRRDELLRPGTVLFLPASADALAALPDASAPKPVVVVPAQPFSYPERRRVFYRVMPGDTLRELAPVLGVTSDELCRWNLLDPGAVLHEGMSLQVFAPKSKKLDEVRVLDESEARILPVGTPEFFAHFEGLRGRARVEMIAKEGDTWRNVAQRHGLTMGQIERINQRERSSALSPGDKYVVYVSTKVASPSKPEKELDPYEDAAVAVANPVGDAAARAAEKKASNERDETPGVQHAVVDKALDAEPLKEKVPEAGKVDEPSLP